MPHDAGEFEQAFALADRIEGWLTREQAASLWDEAARLPPGSMVVEIGSHRGRSAVVLARANPETNLIAVDPFVADWRYGGPATESVFRANIALAGVAGRVTVRVATSAAVRSGWDTPVDLLYVDGSHDYGSVLDDLGWAFHVPAGGRVLVHDAFSSVGVTLALLRGVLFSERLRYLDRVGSLARFEVAGPGLRDRVRMLRELPWWVRNIVLKVLLRLRLRRAARLLGHVDPADPY